MTRRAAISRFTPSVMPAALLERLFVGRERLLGSVMSRIEAAAVGPERNHTLWVGPRGAGKTHLVALTHHRAAALRDAGARLQLAWLPEDPWTIISYDYLLGAIADRLALPVSRDPHQDQEALLTACAEKSGVIVVLAENLDQILAALGDEGQQRLRHYLQTDRSLLFVATSTRLDRRLADQASPFYGFFTTSRLDPFDVEEATAMLVAIAEENGEEDLAEYLVSREGQARLRTVAHLAGGQPRMWSALASSLTVSGLSELVDLLLTRCDDLTPYYQEQLARLSGHQRLVVSELARLDHPVNVKDLAENLRIDQRSIGKTVTELVERNWAAPVTSPLVVGLVDRRRTYYELAEPMARLAFQIKESRGEPLALIVDFLKGWFDTVELKAYDGDQLHDYIDRALAALETDAQTAVVRRLQSLPSRQVGSNDLCGLADDALAGLTEGHSDMFLALSSPLRTTIESLARTQPLDAVRCLVHEVALIELDVSTEQAAVWVERAASLARTTPAAQPLLLRWLGRAHRFDEALAGIDTRPDSLTGPGLLLAQADIALSLASTDRTQQAVALLKSAVASIEATSGEHRLAVAGLQMLLVSAYGLAGDDESAASLIEYLKTELHDLTGTAYPTEVREQAERALASRTLQSSRDRPQL